MKLAIFGNNDGPVQLLKALVKTGQQLPLTLALQKEVSEELNQQYKALLGYQPKIAKNERQLVDLLSSNPPDMIVNCFGNFIFKELLKHYEVFNIHLSPLPSYRGRHPIHHALINGEKYCGISIHRMEKRVDAGTVYWQKLVEVKGYPSVREIREQLLAELENDFADFYRNLLNDSLEPISRKNFKQSYFSPMTPQGSEVLNWQDPKAVVRKVNALREGDFPAFAYLPELIKFTAAWINPTPGDIQSVENTFSYNYSKGGTLVLAGPQPIPARLKDKIDHARTLS